MVPGFDQAGLLGRVAVGAIASKLSGDSAQNGALTAAFDYLFNELGHCYQRGYCTQQVPSLP